MTHVLVKVSKGIIQGVTFFDRARPAMNALAEFVKGMNAEDDDAAVFNPEGLVAKAKSLLDDEDHPTRGDCPDAEMNPDEKEKGEVYLICNPHHPLGFMVASPDDPLGFGDPAEAVSELGQMRSAAGKHLKLYRAIPVEKPVVGRAELERVNEENCVEDFEFQLVEEYVAG